ncbi:MAG: PqqD family protein [Vicinamibacteria bacterium]|nr:PqqD family protein [Vicinamibacteria bacterium]
MSAPRLDVVFRRSERIVTRRIAGECVLVPLASRGVDVDAMYSLNPTAAFVWDHLDGDASGKEIVGELVERFEVDAETATRDYVALVSELEALGAALESR